MMETLALTSFPILCFNFDTIIVLTMVAAFKITLGGLKKKRTLKIWQKEKKEIERKNITEGLDYGGWGTRVKSNISMKRTAHCV